VLEWYDFALFGFFAQQIGAHFFPADDPTASLIAAFGTFAAGFLMRPIGGALFGWVGDKFGRKQALIWSVLAMAFPSFFIGVLPGTESIGIAAPILLLLCRLLQGIAVGGEYGASAVFLVEGAEPGRRGWMGSWAPVGAFAGTLLGSAAGAIVNFTLPPEAVLAWGWRPSCTRPRSSRASPSGSIPRSCTRPPGWRRSRRCRPAPRSRSTRWRWPCRSPPRSRPER
jgi:MHS family proline/betaine transporter-like MFS transporter